MKRKIILIIITIFGVLGVVSFRAGTYIDNDDIECDETSSFICQAVCSSCGTIFKAEDGRKGPGKLKGICPVCGAETNN